MTPLLLLLFIVSSVQYVTSQITMVESGPGTVKPSVTLELTCKVTGASLTDSTNMHGVHWVRQSERKHLEWLGVIWHSAGTVYGSSVQGRLTLSRDTNKGEVFLKLTGMKPEESGTYYCARHRTSGSYYAMDVWGPGTALTVTAEEITSPQVFPLSPFQQKGDGFVTMGCLTKNYIPNPLSVVWNTSSGLTLSGEKNIQFPLSGDPSRYSLVSLMTVSSSDWDSKTYICNVNHFSSNTRKEIPKGCAPPPLPESPTVHILQGSCLSNTNDQVELTCQGYNLTSKDATIKWFINEKERFLPQDLLSLEYSNLYGLHSTVSISLAEWNNGVRVTCRVTDTKTGKSSDDTVRKCSDISNCLGIDVIMVPPTIENLYIQKNAPIACTAFNLKQPTGASFDFNYPGAPASLDIQTEDPQLHLNGFYSVTSFLTVAPETWQSNKEFTCIFRFPGLTEKIIRTISKKTETKLIPPNVAVFPPPPEDIAKDELCTITCIAYGFYPQDIYMGWVDENDVEISKDQHVNSEPKRNNRNQSFSASSLLSVPCSEWKKGKHYGCVVGHEANPQKLTLKATDIHSGNPAKVNVSVVMSDATLNCY